MSRPELDNPQESPENIAFREAADLIRRNFDLQAFKEDRLLAQVPDLKELLPVLTTPAETLEERTLHALGGKPNFRTAFNKVCKTYQPPRPYWRSHQFTLVAINTDGHFYGSYTYPQETSIINPLTIATSLMDRAKHRWFNNSSDDWHKLIRSEYYPSPYISRQISTVVIENPDQKTPLERIVTAGSTSPFVDLSEITRNVNKLTFENWRDITYHKFP